MDVLIEVFKEEEGGAFLDTDTIITSVEPDSDLEQESQAVLANLNEETESDEKCSLSEFILPHAVLIDEENVEPFWSGLFTSKAIPDAPSIEAAPTVLKRRARKRKLLTVQEDPAIISKSTHQPHKCNHCGTICESDSDLRNHEETCRARLRAMPILKNLLIRPVTLNGDVLFKCDHCGKTFLEEKNLIEHKLVHSDGNRFACGRCSRTFELTIELAAHVCRFDCERCDARFRLRSKLSEHSRKVHTKASQHRDFYPQCKL